MKYIELTRGKRAVVDDCDFEYLSRWKWHYGNGYAVRHTRRIHGKQKTVIMHRELSGAKLGEVTHHRDRDRLNDTRANLYIYRSIGEHTAYHHTGRKASVEERRRRSKAHQGIKYGGISIYFGISWHKARKKWRARIKRDGKEFHLGLFENEGEAAEAYNRKAQELFGDFACLNDIVLVGETYPLFGRAC